MNQDTPKQDTRKGAFVYSPLVLTFYDAWVLGISNRYAWRCSTRDVLLPFFRKYAGTDAHLDVGVGTGFYPATAGLPAAARIALMDLNASTLQAAQRRLNRASVTLIQHDVMEPLPSRGEAPFDAISMFYLLHCLPGTMADKSRAFGQLKPLLKPDGVLYGATILGEEAGHTGLGRKLMEIYNRKGIFGNWHDTRDSLERGLREHFGQVEVRVVGKVALFEARRPTAVNV